VTVVESVNASGWVLPLCVISKSKKIIQGWFCDLPGDWRFELFPNGWTTDKISLKASKDLYSSYYYAYKGKTSTLDSWWPW